MLPGRHSASDTASLFAETVMGLSGLYDWQKLVAETVHEASVRERVRIAVRTPNESGKSSIVIPLIILRWLERYPRAKVVLTSADARQLDSQLMRALHSYRHPHLQHWEFLSREIRTPDGGVLVAFTTDEAARAEGHHGSRGAPLLMIVDEAKSVPNEIFEAIDRCGYAVLLVISSPGLRSGNFYDCFSTNRSGHICFEIAISDCPHISQEKIRDMLEKYGDKHPLVRSSIFGEFMDIADGESFIVPFNPLMAIVNNPPHARVSKHEYAAFCDFAITRDENVLAIRSGNKLLQLIAWHGTDAVSIVGRFLIEFRKHGLKADQIWGDSTGLGLPMVDMLRDAGWPINRFSFGAPATDPDRYVSRGAEVWHSFSGRVQRGELALINDPTLISQLTSRKTTIDARGRLGIEKKDDMAKRGVRSPDRADAVIGAFAHGVLNFAVYAKRMNDPWEALEEAYEGYDRELRSAGRYDSEHRQQLEDLGGWTGN
jgi:phage terminase large subunit